LSVTSSTGRSEDSHRSAKVYMLLSFDPFLQRPVVLFRLDPDLHGLRFALFFERWHFFLYGFQYFRDPSRLRRVPALQRNTFVIDRPRLTTTVGISCVTHRKINTFIRLFPCSW
jgi:hypothetical protein